MHEWTGSLIKQGFDNVGSPLASDASQRFDLVKQTKLQGN